MIAPRILPILFLLQLLIPVSCAERLSSARVGPEKRPVPDTAFFTYSKVLVQR